MNRLALAFFATATLCVLGGMVWGLAMAATGDHTMMPAHAHLNLMGWATLALMGTFYGLTGRQDRLGWTNYWLSTLSVAISIPALAAMLGGTPAAEPLAIGGSLLAVLGALVFLAAVFGSWRAAKPA